MVHISGGSEQVSIWFRKNGLDIPDSTTDVALKGNGSEDVAAWNYVISMNAGDYFELIFLAIRQ